MLFVEGYLRHYVFVLFSGVPRESVLYYLCVVMKSTTRHWTPAGPPYKTLPTTQAGDRSENNHFTLQEILN